MASNRDESLMFLLRSFAPPITRCYRGAIQILQMQMTERREEHQRRGGKEEGGGEPEDLREEEGGEPEDLPE
ncbi:hypothetical protein L6452_14073 [Arctium lappa]|uniref:Uncharacterized protein n=1 Tax=Arctium lappa TaxID=4217 RepID=A0ACB9CK10_ARCLA|nr:hypothetical protein L6452_14073 [Arctium lappa]